MAGEYRKKLIEVALPLDLINAAAVAEKSNPFLKGHPRGMQQWWSRKPLAICRGILFASLVDDPGNDLPPDEAKRERARLFRILEQLVRWENTNNEAVLSAARDEIARSTDGKPPPVLDPFCGGGSIPLEAQRLGLEAHASDLNPVAVLITKALIEIPPKFAGRAPVNPAGFAKGAGANWNGASGLADDVRHYGKWIRDEAEKRVGYLYPKLKLPQAQGGGDTNVIAWIWARTVTCTNPACNAELPLVTSFWLSNKKGKEAWVEPIIDHRTRVVRFEVRNGAPPPEKEALVRNGTSTGRGANFACLVCNTAPTEGEIKYAGMQGRIGRVLLGAVAEGARARTFVGPAAIPGEQEVPDQDLSGLIAELDDDPRAIWCKLYGLLTFADLFLPRQLAVLITLSDLVVEVKKHLLDQGAGEGYAEAVATYLAFAVDKATDYGNSLCTWNPTNSNVGHLFTKQGIGVAWTFAEANLLFGGLSVAELAAGIATSLERCPANIQGYAKQVDSTVAVNGVAYPLISTDPPYYDNIGYSGLADFFYVWLRRSIGRMYPELFSTLLTPKAQELVATPYRFNGDRRRAAEFFEEGLGKALESMRMAQNPDYPLTIYYAFKQAETQIVGSHTTVASTGWETMLEGVIRAGLSVTGTWPMRSERSARSTARGTNALAASIVLVCRPRRIDAPLATRRELVRALNKEMPAALDVLTRGADEVSPVAPVDLAQAAIGPGISIFSRYGKVLEATGDSMKVRTALELINETIDSYLSSQEGEQDSPTRFCLSWYREHGAQKGDFGNAQVLARARDVDVERLERQGLLTSERGKVWLRPAAQYPLGPWDPATALPLTTWEATHRLVAALEREGVSAAAIIVRRLGGKAEDARSLAYLLYAESDRQRWAAEAGGYNNLVVLWPDILRAATQSQGEQQDVLL
jgi:putative DNA methylase